MTIDTATVTVYRLRDLPNHGWADITLDEGQSSGRISISSDFGNWANYWGACGESFKKFLCGIDIYYFAGKVSASNWVDADATINRWKQHLFEERRNENIEADEAREIYEQLKNLQHVPGEALLYAAYEIEEIAKFFEYQMDVVTDVNPQFKIFWQRAWKPFVEYLKLQQQEAL